MRIPSRTVLHAALALAITTAPIIAADVAKKHVLLLAGRPSHGPGEHEHNAGLLLLKKCLDDSGLPVESKLHLNAEWPDTAELAAADTLVFYCDGGPGHLLLQN